MNDGPKLFKGIIIDVVVVDNDEDNEEKETNRQNSHSHLLYKGHYQCSAGLKFKWIALYQTRKYLFNCVYKTAESKPVNWRPVAKW